MSTDAIKKSLSELLPDRNNGISVERDNAVEKASSDIQVRATAQELARAKFKEKQKLQRLEERASRGFMTEHQEAEINEKKETIRQLDVLSAEPELAPALISNMSVGKASKLLATQGTTRNDVVKLLTSLNINLNLQLTKQDTMNLLSCLLTCNEQQLIALKANKKVPIAIKTVITRLLEDAKNGSIDTVEKLWDRIFGRGNMLLELPQEQQTMTGIIPNVPVSRETYMIIKETIIGK